MSLAKDINWSFSKLSMYESCAYRFRLKHIDRCPEPPLPPDNPMERGNRIHNNLEWYVKDMPGGDLGNNEAKKLDAFKPALAHLKALYGAEMATAEQNWFFNQDWDECAKQSVWLWSKLDFSVQDQSQSHVIVGDYKSGRSGYKTAEHIQQLQLYSAVSALKFEWADSITAELWYVDEGWVRQSTYTREQALKYVGRFQSRADRIYADRLFRPNPNKITCKYCPFSPRGTGACAVGV